MSCEAPHLHRERRTIATMVGLFCADHHTDRTDGLCPSCREFLGYAERRLEKCPYGDEKPTCANCPVHCYKPAQRKRAKTIMRHAGPRMLFRHPLLVIAHKLDGLRNVRHLRELTREQRRQRSRRPTDV